MGCIACYVPMVLINVTYCSQKGKYKLIILIAGASASKRGDAGLRRQWDFCELGILSHLLIEAQLAVGGLFSSHLSVASSILVDQLKRRNFKLKEDRS
ncbi:uncharacterized protein G2W53_042222 [Senna tora]|uniref:Uncharacterized protein n=1 Tax=Senna tora TaxID=362788 RepID=A0A834SGY2_9FABA|nr:uncharacterized protein G2W53_042222 [Senna tora]